MLPGKNFLPRKYSFAYFDTIACLIMSEAVDCHIVLNRDVKYPETLVHDPR